MIIAKIRKITSIHCQIELGINPLEPYRDNAVIPSLVTTGGKLLGSTNAVLVLAADELVLVFLLFLVVLELVVFVVFVVLVVFVTFVVFVVFVFLLVLLLSEFDCLWLSK